MTRPNLLPGAEPPPRVEVFLQTIRRSQLLAEPELAAALQQAPPEAHADAGALADHFVRYGKLSRFQANKLLRGHWRGLFVGPYQVLGIIGRGGCCKVYLARDQRAGGLVALKVLPPHHARARRRLLARFRREMQICPLVRHPDLARTFETGEDRGVHYIAMEYFPGKSLARLVNEAGPMAPERAARLLAQVADAIHHAHLQGIVHRDLKPGNVQVTPDDHAKVLDLGLALVQGQEEMDLHILGGKGRIVGTMDYIAPEQTADPSHVDGRSDIYSLGCTLYFVLTGRVPFPGGTSLEKVQRQRAEEPTPIQKLRPSLSPPMVDLVTRMMSKDPARRPESAVIVATALRRIGGIPEPKRADESGPAPVGPWWLAAILALCGLAGGAAWFCFSR